ncbi:MAG: prepilin-type N-terminal cleavage/methylation domain-containing protein [Defluviitaleaceae bacterium]|nr:prepilin-type N-terminal cleavage/methylation domain-containing protein [Defluviitaleaceae bacterium]
MKRSATGGFTLLEMVVTMAIWMILIAGASRLLWYASSASANILNQQEALASARIAVDAIAVNVQMAEEIVLQTDGDGMLRSLSLRQISPQGNLEWYLFTYDRHAAIGTPGYRRLIFTGQREPNVPGGHNELASNLKAVQVRISEDRSLLYITVVSCDSWGEPVTLQGTVDIRYKIVR